MQALIIDDSRAMRQILRKIIEPLGFAITEAVDGRDALDRLSQLPDVELVLVDWNMPELNGLEFVRAVRAKPEYRDLKLVMVTTETEPGKMARALMAGVDEFLMKPFTREMLLDKLHLIGVSTLSTNSSPPHGTKVAPHFNNLVSTANPHPITRQAE